MRQKGYASDKKKIGSVTWEVGTARTQTQCCPSVREAPPSPSSLHLSRSGVNIVDFEEIKKIDKNIDNVEEMQKSLC